jgi:hypothetical protein
MSDKTPTFEEIEKHLDSFNLTDFQPGGKLHAGAGGAQGLSIPNVCPAYKMIRPILLAILAFPLIPKKFKDAIKAFMGVLDMICP